LSTANYDPEEEEGRKRPSHITRREIIIVGIFVLIAAIAGIPVYRYLLDLKNTHICTQNLFDIGQAMEAYAADNEDRFPPVYMTDDAGNFPRTFDNKTVFSWASVISQYAKKPEVFSCPAASPEEGVLNAPGGNGNPFVSDYGMYAALSTVPRGSISQISTIALVADTDNQGTDGTADPLPFKDAQGNLIPDGIVIGLDTTNLTSADRSRAHINAAKYATRLAMPDTDSRGFHKNSFTRHPDGLNMLMADLHREHIHGDEALVTHPGKNAPGITGRWAVP
jgi:prepilin-type processing-associated H-X9-DG protein